jgi:hypothetical protein
VAFCCWSLWGFGVGSAGANSETAAGLTTLPASTPEAREFLEKLKTLPAPLPWEAKGFLVLSAPGEYYRMDFRLLAQGPEALRLELFDPFGRPAYYLTVFQGRVRAVSPGDQKPLPLNPALLAAALSGESGFSLEEVLGLLWGRWPLKKDLLEGATVTLNKGPSFRQLFLPGDPSQTIRIAHDPLRVLGGEFQKKGAAGPVRVTFAEFVELSGAWWPREIKVRDEGAEKQFTLTYEQMIPRSDFPEEAFRLSDTGRR